MTFSACAAMAQWALHQGALLSSAMATSSTAVGGAILVGAGVYQRSPLKGRCLTGYQSPLGFLMGNWRDGLRGAFAMGMRHGTFCLGCCWALMGVLFVVGVMNLVWVGVLTVFVLVERIGPTRVRLARTGGAIMIALGVIMVSTGALRPPGPPPHRPFQPPRPMLRASQALDATFPVPPSCPGAAVRGRLR